MTPPSRCYPPQDISFTDIIVLSPPDVIGVMLLLNDLLWPNCCGALSRAIVPDVPTNQLDAALLVDSGSAGVRGAHAGLITIGEAGCLLPSGSGTLA